MKKLWERVLERQEKRNRSGVSLTTTSDQASLSTPKGAEPKATPDFLETAKSADQPYSPSLPESPTTWKPAFVIDGKPWHPRQTKALCEENFKARGFPFIGWESEKGKVPLFSEPMDEDKVRRAMTSGK